MKRISLSWDHEEAVRIADEALKRRGRKLSSEEARNLAARSVEKRITGSVEMGSGLCRQCGNSLPANRAGARFCNKTCRGLSQRGVKQTDERKARANKSRLDKRLQRLDRKHEIDKEQEMKSRQAVADASRRIRQRLLNKKLRSILCAALSRVKARGGKKCGKTVEMLGCSIDDLRIYLENLFSPGMSWQNHGTKWEVDHIMPLARFDLTNSIHVQMAVRYTNLQPLWIHENAAKADKIIPHQALLI